MKTEIDIEKLLEIAKAMRDSNSEFMFIAPDLFIRILERLKCLENTKDKN